MRSSLRGARTQPPARGAPSLWARIRTGHTGVQSSLPVPRLPLATASGRNGLQTSAPREHLRTLGAWLDRPLGRLACTRPCKYQPTVRERGREGVWASSGPSLGSNARRTVLIARCPGAVGGTPEPHLRLSYVPSVALDGRGIAAERGQMKRSGARERSRPRPPVRARPHLCTSCVGALSV